MDTVVFLVSEHDSLLRLLLTHGKAALQRVSKAPARHYG